MDTFLELLIIQEVFIVREKWYIYRVIDYSFIWTDKGEFPLLYLDISIILAL